ncbi:MAG TPA: hypothetical protein VFY16_00530 [Gemmatimonadaceae bacterium]|nr:hypothetical protein [Gemmatimonadaceae bacterium]
MSSPRPSESESSEPVPAPGRTPESGEISVHIFIASATLVGVCLTVIGIFQALSRATRIDHIADEILSLDAIGFLVACLFAYTALRQRDARVRRRCARVAHVVFITALAIMTATCMLMAYELI